jgi:hypothetical protein
MKSAQTANFRNQNATRALEDTIQREDLTALADENPIVTKNTRTNEDWRLLSSLGMLLAGADAMINERESVRQISAAGRHASLLAQLDEIEE